MSEVMDPVFRCCSCNKLVKTTTLHKIGMCSKCGNRRVASVTVLNTGERNKIVDWGYDDFAELFEAVEVDE